MASSFGVSGAGALLPTAVDLETRIWNIWQRHAERTPDREAIVHWTVGSPAFRWSWGNLVETATAIARDLAEHGIREGDVCALIIRHHPRFYPLYLAVCAVGAVPAVLAYPSDRLHPEKFRDGLEGMARMSGLDWVLTERALEDKTAPLVTRPGSTVKGLLFPLEWSGRESASSGLPSLARVTPDTPCLLQHSSGTTGLQKGVVLSHRAVLQHVRRYGEAIALQSEDRVISWLPLYHDMGLIAAFYLPLVSGTPLVQLDPFEWVSAPVVLLEAINGEGATLCWMPNFAFRMMADKVRDDDLAGLKLASMRMFVNCSEPVRADSHDRFLTRFGPLGLKRTAVSACYAMAETTFAVTQTAPGTEPRRITARRSQHDETIEITTDTIETTKTYVSSGLPIGGVEVRIVDDEGRELLDGSVGNIAVRSESMFGGYRNNHEKTAEVLRDGWLHTGDVGFRSEGEYYVVGRKKDIIIVAGKNVYPEDIEDVVSRVDGVIPGRVVAFGVEDEGSGTEQICVVAEVREHGATTAKALRRAIVAAAMAIDVTVSRVYLAPPRWLIKSSSGKPSRTANRERAVELLSSESLREAK